MPRVDSETIQPLLAALETLAIAPSAQPQGAQVGSLPRWLATLEIATLPAIEDTVRRQIRWGWQYGEPSGAGSSERRALGQKTAAIANLPSDALLTALASFHGSGYVREAAVRRLLDNRDGSEVPFVLLRCNDWVPTIAELAQRGLRDRLQPDYAGHVLRSYRLIEHLQHAQRNSLTKLLHDVRTALQQPAARPALQEACAASDKSVRRAAYVLLAEAYSGQPAPAAGQDLRHLLLQALHSRDLWLRIWAARSARQRLYGRALVEVLAPAQHDRSAPVRREALLAFLDDFPELRRSLLDPCAGVRSMVRFYLRRKAHVDPAAVYQDELAKAWSEDCLGSTPTTARRICVALDGLGETASGEQAPSSRSLRTMATQSGPGTDTLLYDPRPRIRRSALRMLVRLDRSEDKTRSLYALRAALSDSAPGVVRVALEILAGESGNAALLRLGADEIWHAFQSRPESGTRRRLLLVLTQFGRWTRLGYLLRACLDPAPQVAALARHSVERALHGQLYTGPSAAERTRIEQVLPALQKDSETRALGQRVRSALASFA
jgi:HEAT repeat protein